MFPMPSPSDYLKTLTTVFLAGAASAVVLAAVGRAMYLLGERSTSRAS